MSEETIQIVTFSMGNDEFGVDISRIKEIIRIPEITKVPRAAQFVEGVINLRGQIIPVIDLRKRLGLESAGKSERSRVIVVLSEDQIIGFLVDAVSQVLRLPMSAIDPPPSVLAGVSAAYIQGVGKLDKRLIILINFDKIISEREKDEMRGMKI